jgi:hypothetical protein
MVLNQFSGLIWSLHRQHPVFLARELVVIHEKFFQLFFELLAHIVDGLHVSEAMGVLFDGNDAIVALLAFFILLFTLNHADRTARQHAPWECGLIHKHEHIDGITVLRQGGRDESKVVRESHSGWQDFLQFEDVLLAVEREFVAAPFRGLDDYSQQLLVSFIDRLQAGGIG